MKKLLVLGVLITAFINPVNAKQLPCAKEQGLLSVPVTLTGNGKPIEVVTGETVSLKPGIYRLETHAINGVQYTPLILDRPVTFKPLGIDKDNKLKWVIKN